MTKRPHPKPCTCEDCWKSSATLMAEVEAGKRPPPPPDVPPRKPYEPPLGALLQGFIAKLAKDSGQSEEELREMAREMGEELPKPPPTKYSREVVKARGVPEIHLEHVYDREPLECDALAAVKRFLDEAKHILVLAGSVGVCKTGSACWALRQKPGVFVTADVLVGLPAAREPDSRELWRRVREGQVLVLDDLGREYVDGKGWGVGVMTGLIDFRYSNKLKTIVTTNLRMKKWVPKPDEPEPPPQFTEIYGERIVDRIREVGRFIELGGKSVRA